MTDAVALLGDRPVFSIMTVIDGRHRVCGAFAGGLNESFEAGVAKSREVYSVDVSGNTAVAGAFNDAEVAYDAGAAYVFRFKGSTWTLDQKLTASDGAQGDFFGHAVAIAGSRIIVGAHLNDDLGNKSGSAYIFHDSGAQWYEQAKLLASDGGASDYFGKSVAIDGDVAVIGAEGDDDMGYQSGAAYVFHRVGASWLE